MCAIRVFDHLTRVKTKKIVPLKKKMHLKLNISSQKKNLNYTVMDMVNDFLKKEPTSAKWNSTYKILCNSDLLN